MTTKLIKSRYEIVDILSEDILSFLAIAKRQDSGKLVYIWKYKKELLKPLLINRMISFCEKLMKIKHENVLQMIDYAYDGMNFYTVFSYEEGLISLGAYLKEKGSLNAEEVNYISSKLIQIMKEVESVGLLSGNINLYSLYLNKKFELRLTCLLLPIMILRNYIADLQVLEEAIFYAPEFLQNKEYSIRSDIYSFGILLYFLSTNKWPYEYTQNVLALKKSLIKKVPHPSSYNKSISSDYERLIEICIAKDPNERFESFKELDQVRKKSSLLFEKREKVTFHNNIHKDLLSDISLRINKRLKSIFAYVVSFFILLVLFLSGYLLYLNYLTAIPEIEVPEVIGLSSEEAQYALSKYGLKSKIVGSYSRIDLPKGFVAETRPPAGRLVKKSRVIKLFTSKGALDIEVPNLIGRTIDQCSVLIEQDELKIEVVGEKFSDKYEAGYIIEQVPSANSLAQAGSKILVTLSKGYPVNITITGAPSFFFLNKKNVFQVKVNFQILDDWEPKEILIQKIYKNNIEKLYSDIHFAGDNFERDFIFEKGSIIEVYYNKNLAFSQKIEKITSDDEKTTNKK